MSSKKLIFSFMLVVAILSLVFNGYRANADKEITFSDLISQADKFNGKTVTLEAYYYSGFEISAICESVILSTSGPWGVVRIVPTGTLVWVNGDDILLCHSHREELYETNYNSANIIDNPYYDNSM